MGEMYERIAALCERKGVKPGKMCADIGISRGNIGDLKMGRIKKLSAENLEKVAKYFGVTTDHLLGAETEKAPAPEGERRVSDDDIMFALWGGSDDMTEEDLADVKRYAAFVQERKRQK